MSLLVAEYPGGGAGIPHSMYQEDPQRRREDGLTRCIVIRLEYIDVIDVVFLWL